MAGLCARVAELADARDLGSRAERREGSSPSSRSEDLRQINRQAHKPSLQLPSSPGGVDGSLPDLRRVAVPELVNQLRSGEPTAPPDGRGHRTLLTNSPRSFIRAASGYPASCLRRLTNNRIINAISVEPRGRHRVFSFKDRATPSFSGAAIWILITHQAPETGAAFHCRFFVT